MNDGFKGVKNIQINCQTRYPIVSAYEFEFLKKEETIQRLLKPCTIYFILQRPVLYFSNLCTQGGVLSFEIRDGTESPPLKCELIPSDNGFCQPDEELEIEVQFYKKMPDLTQPYNDVAGFKLHSLEGEFIGWFSPNVILYGLFDGNLKVRVDGPIQAYLDYEVHYIGQAFSQDIWKRLTGHEKMQSILTLEDTLNTKNLKAPFEISLLMLDIDGLDEGTFFPYLDFGLSEGVEPIIYEFSDEEDDPEFEKFFEPNIDLRAKELTNEVEAFLVSTFKPKYNEILFSNYPNITSGTRSVGYSESFLFIQKMPAILRTDHHTQDLIFNIPSN
jgi:hypothetical protein